MQALQPQYFERFRCIGADCEDTCCTGWGIIVDRQTYVKYQDPRLGRIAGETLSGLIEINPASSSSSDYAKMRLVGTQCCALHEGLCSIQQTLGEPYIPDTCSSFPRVFNVTNGVVEESLNLSCPEAARLVLNDPDAMLFQERSVDDLTLRPDSLSMIGDAPDEQVNAVRRLMIQMIQERSRPLWQRIASLGLAVDELARVPSKPPMSILEDHLANWRQGSFDGMLGNLAFAPDAQLEAVLELIVSRIGAEYISPRFLECYREFMRGLGWSGESTMEELAARYHEALESYCLPFIRRHEHLFENYLVNYMFRTLFPYGRKQRDLKVVLDSSGESMRSAYLLLGAHYAIIRAMLIGMAGLHQDNLSMEHVVKLVQSCTKAFQHSNSFSEVVLRCLAKFSDDPARGVAMLVMD